MDIYICINICEGFLIKNKIDRILFCLNIPWAWGGEGIGRGGEGSGRGPQK